MLLSALCIGTTGINWKHLATSYSMFIAGYEIVKCPLPPAYRARIFIKFAHISKNSMVWLPGRGTKSVMPESTDEVRDEGTEPSDDFAGASASESVFWIGRTLPADPERLRGAPSVTSSVWRNKSSY